MITKRSPKPIKIILIGVLLIGLVVESATWYVATHHKTHLNIQPRTAYLVVKHGCPDCAVIEDKYETILDTIDKTVPISLIYSDELDGASIKTLGITSVPSLVYIDSDMAAINAYCLKADPSANHGVSFDEQSIDIILAAAKHDMK